jgi:hypothetical protein
MGQLSVLHLPILFTCGESRAEIECMSAPGPGFSFVQCTSSYIDIAILSPRPDPEPGAQKESWAPLVTFAVH